jgi:hypothetical protein
MSISFEERVFEELRALRDQQYNIDKGVRGEVCLY